MVILKGKQLRNFYKNSGNFFSRGRRELKVSAFERKTFEFLQKMSFMFFDVFAASVHPPEVDNFIFLILMEFLCFD